MPLQKVRPRGIQSHSQAGMTTIEVLVATIVFAIASTGLAGALSVGLFAAEKNHDATLALDLAQSQLENIIAAEYREAGDYPIFVELPLDYETVTTTETIKPGLLQKVVTRVTFRGNPEAEITALTKALLSSEVTHTTS